MMTPIFLAFHNAADETCHVLLPRASPHATTHLPNIYIDSIDLTVFRNDTHSIARLRVFDNYVTLSAVPEASSTICILLPSSEQVRLPASTHNDTTWFVLLDGAQFTYADLRCSVEFDYDHSISNSMRPPDLPCHSEHISNFDDSDMIPDPLDVHPDPNDNSAFAEELNTNTTELRLQSGKTSEPLSGLQVVRKLTVPETETAQENAQQFCSNDLVPSSTDSLENEVTQLPQAIQPTTADSDPVAIRQPGEESQLLNPAQRSARLHRDPEQESQILIVIASKSTSTSHPTRKSGEESQVFQEQVVTKPTENSISTTRFFEKVQVRNKAFVNQNLEPDSNTFEPNVQSRRPHAPKSSQSVPVSPVDTQTSTSSSKKVENVHRLQPLKLHRFADSPDILHPSIPWKGTFSEPSGVKTQLSPSKGQRKRKHSLPTLDEDSYSTEPALLPSKGQKKTRSTPLLLDKDLLHTDVDVSSTVIVNVSEPLEEAGSSPMLWDDNSHATDASTSSTVTVDVPNLKRRKKHRRPSLRSDKGSIDIPHKPVIVFSTNCTIQNKKRTMDTFVQLGGTASDDISHADMLCVPANDGLRKTPKLILAVILGKIIVTEDWLVQCIRTGRFPSAEKYQPVDKKREREWGVKLPDALNQGLRNDTRLDQLFAGYKFYLTQSLQDQLSRTGNMDAFVKIATSMGVLSVRKRLPVQFGAKMIVMGVTDDFDAAATGKLGLKLYDKDLLVMSALRGYNEVDAGEFQIEIPIKEEQLS